MGGGGEAKTWFDDVCKVKYRVRHLKGQPQYIVVQAHWAKVVCTAETVEKVQMANSDNFRTVKNQQLTGHRKPKNAQI